jgi:hypothetical protein
MSGFRPFETIAIAAVLGPFSTRSTRSLVELGTGGARLKAAVAATGRMRQERSYVTGPRRKGGLASHDDAAKLRLAQAAMVARDTKVGDLCKQLGVTVRRSIGPSAPTAKCDRCREAS